MVRPRYYGALGWRKVNRLRRRVVPSKENPKPRIALTLYDFHVGGIENWLYRLARTLRTEFDFYFLATAVPDFLPKFRDVGTCAYLPSPNKMRAYLQRHNIDVVQVHNQRWPIDAALAADVRHIIERTDGTRSCTRVNKSGLSLVIASSRGTVPMISKHFPAEQIRLIYNGIDLNEVDAAPQKRPWSEDSFVVGRTSRFGRGKNLKMLIEAASQLKGHLPRLKIVLIGGDSAMPGAEPIEAELREQAAPLGDAVEFMGFVENTLPLVKGFDVGTCVSNPTNEGIPNSLIEAMASRKPIISTAVDQVPELVQDGANGILIPPGDVGALCGAIERLATDPGLCRQLGEAGRHTIEGQFSLEQAAAQYAAVYRELLGR
jgi:glycosyltransferase involved in cell wall biosynthesis